MISSSDNCLMCFTRARIELPCAPTKYVLPSLRAGAILSSQNGRARSKVTFKFSASGDHWIVKWSITTVSVCWVFIITVHCRRQYIVRTTPDVNLFITKLFSSFCFVFTSQTTVVTFVQAPWFFNWNPQLVRSFKSQVSCFDRTFQYWSISVVKFDTSFFDQFTSVDRLLCTFFRQINISPTSERLALFHSDSPWRAKPILPLDGSPFYSPRFPRLSILFY